MQNLVVTNDNSIFVTHLLKDSEDFVASVSTNSDLGEIFLLSNCGILFGLNTSSEWSFLRNTWKLENLSNAFNKWFLVRVIYEIGSIVCISHEGLIISIKFKTITGEWDNNIELEGTVDNGISNAAFSPDQNSLIVVTKDNSIFHMTNTFELINEVTIEPFEPESATCIEWRGDGLFFAVSTLDLRDNIRRIRIYNRNLEMVVMCKNINGECTSLLPVVAYANNGSLVASVYKRSDGKQLVSYH